MDMDTAMAEDEVLKDELAGSTAVVVLLKDKKMYCVRKNIHMFILSNFYFSNLRIFLNLGKCWRFESYSICKWCS